MSTSTQFPSSTASYHSEYISDVESMFDQYFTDSVHDNDIKQDPDSSVISPISDPEPSSVPTTDSSPLSTARSQANSPQPFDIMPYEDQQMENMWNEFALEDNNRYRPPASQSQAQGPMSFTAQGGLPALTPIPSTTSLPSLASIQPNSDIHYPQYLSSSAYAEEKPTINSPLQTLISGYPSNTQAVHGQVTPVEDNQQAVPDFSQDIFADVQFNRQQPDSPPQSRRGSTPPKSSRRSRKGSKSGPEEEEAQELKRKRFLERNRVAASKCRQKKKEWMNTLEENSRRAQSTAKFLGQTVSTLKDELLILKGELLKHHACDCPAIKAYLQNEAQKVAIDQHKIVNAVTTPKSRQLSIAGSEMSDMSGIGEMDMFDCGSNPMGTQ